MFRKLLNEYIKEDMSKSKRPRPQSWLDWLKDFAAWLDGHNAQQERAADVCPGCGISTDKPDVTVVVGLKCPVCGKRR